MDGSTRDSKEVQFTRFSYLDKNSEKRSETNGGRGGKLFKKKSEAGIQ